MGSGTTARLAAMSLVVLAGATVGWWSLRGHRNVPAPFEPPSRITEAGLLCPWRDPEADLARFFPAANRRDTRTLILSGRRVELARELGRQPTAEENALQVHHALHDNHPVGTILTRRVKGEHGGIELVLAVTPEGRVRGVKIQRHREPPEVASVLGEAGWLNRFEGRDRRSDWDAAGDCAGLPAGARSSAQAVVEGIRSLLILLAAGETSSPRAHEHRDTL